MAADRAGAGARGLGARGLSLDTHRAIEAGVGLALVLVPFALRFGIEDGVDFTGFGIVVCGALGLAAATLGFAGTRSTLDASAGSHATFDRALTAVTGISAVLFAVSGDGPSALALAAATAMFAALMLVTRYGR